MKNNGVVFVTILVAIITLSCSREKETISEEVGRKLTITAYREDSEVETKTTRDVNGVVSWSAHEDISLFYSAGTNGGSKFTSTNEASATVADFSGTINVVTGVVEGDTERYFYGIYPFKEENSVNADGSIVTVIPDIQTAAEGTFADNHFVSMGRSRGLEMGFYNLCGGFKFKLLHEGVTKVTLHGNNNEELAGKVKVVLQDGRPLVSEVLDPKTELVMTCPDGGAFKTGVEYFFVMRPITFENGFTFTMETEDLAIGTREINVTIDVKRSLFSFASAAIDTGVEYKLSGNIAFAEQAIKEYFVRYHDKNGDGEISYEEAALVTSIGADAFKSNTEITTFDEMRYFTGLKVIGAYSFYGCSNLTSICIPESVETVGQCAFYNCTNLTSSVSIGYSDTPGTYYGAGKINNEAFYGCSKLSSLSIGNAITYIGHDSFSRCTGLKSISIGDSVTTIDNQAFLACRSLTDLYLGKSLIEIGPSAFASCEGLTSLIIPSSVSRLFRSSFEWCRGLNAIIVEEGNSVFDSRDNCNAIIRTSDNELVIGCKNTIIPESVPSIGASAFTGALGLTSIYIPDSVVSIGDGAFSYCSDLTSVRLSNSITEIKSSTFAQTGLVSIVIPDSVTSIGSSVFSFCKSLTNITIPNSITQIPSEAFLGCSALTSITLPDGLVGIEGNAFYSCSSLYSVIIPEGVTTIGNNAFVYCGSLTEVTLPESLVEIGSRSFYECSNLQAFTIFATTPPALSSDALVSTNNCPIYVPSGSVDTYKAAEGWSDYADRIQGITKPFPEGNVFDEDAYITYVANHQEWQNQTNEVLYAYDTQFNAGVSGTRMEMKFQIPDYDSGEAILSYHSDGGLAIDASNVSFYYNRRYHEDGDTWYEKEFTQGIGGGIAGTGTVFLTAFCSGNQIEVTVNGHEATIPVSVSSLNAQYIFSHYDMESGDGTKYMYLAGVPEGARLYYVKIWDGDELVYFGHASRAVCSYSSAEEYCWYEEIGNNYTFAQSLHSLTSSEFNNPYPSSPIVTVRQPFGGGMD